jgi:osmotically-inducible protein OsmY
MSFESPAILDGDDLALRVHLFLSGRSQPALRNLEVSAHRGTVLLRGRTQSFYHKQLALELTRRVAGVIQINDELVVDDSQASVKPVAQALAPPIDLQLLSPPVSTPLSLP